MRRWDQLQDSYMGEYRARGLSALTVSHTESRLERWGRWLKRRRPRVAIEGIDADTITQYMTARASFRAKSTVYGTLSTMRGFGDFLVRQGLREAGHERAALREQRSRPGHDLGDATGPVAKFIREAIRDVDPTRVMLECRFLSVQLTDGEHPVALEMGLPTEKRVSCTRHGHGLEGQRLDDVAGDFKLRFCASCPDKTPRPAGWTFADR